MRTTKVGNVTFHHKADYTGNVIIEVRNDDDPLQLTAVPFTALQELVAARHRAAAAEQIRQMSNETFLNTITPDLTLASLQARLIESEDDDMAEALDSLCHDVASQLGSEANNGGIEDQISFLSDYMGRALLVTKLREILGDSDN